jgi:hypothetical protein
MPRSAERRLAGFPGAADLNLSPPCGIPVAADLRGGDRMQGRIARTYLELIDAIALRLIDLNVQHLALDERCGLATGYTGKLLGPKLTRHYGPMSLDLHLQALGLRLIVEPDPDRPPALSDTREFRPRDPAAVLAERLRTREGRALLLEHLRQAGRKGAAKRRRMAIERREAREAAAAKWRQPQDRPADIAGDYFDAA